MTFRASTANLKHALLILALPDQRKHFCAWVLSLLQPPHRSDLPWLTFDAVRFLKERLPIHPYVLEYGSGASTAFWLKRGGRCVSIEHDAAFFERLGRRLGHAASLDYRLRPPEPDPSDLPMDPSDPHQYRSSDPRYRDVSFRKYSSEADVFPDASFDVVLVDGRARPSCILHGAPKVKPGGYLILDNADRPYYTARTASILQGFTRHTFPGAGPFGPWFWETDIYERQR